MPFKQLALTHHNHCTHCRYVRQAHRKPDNSDDNSPQPYIEIINIGCCADSHSGRRNSAAFPAGTPDEQLEQHSGCTQPNKSFSGLIKLQDTPVSAQRNVKEIKSLLLVSAQAHVIQLPKRIRSSLLCKGSGVSQRSDSLCSYKRHSAKRGDSYCSHNRHWANILGALQTHHTHQRPSVHRSPSLTDVPRSNGL